MIYLIITLILLAILTPFLLWLIYAISQNMYQNQSDKLRRVLKISFSASLVIIVLALSLLFLI